MKIVSAAHSHIGRKRKVNQDSFRLEPEHQIFVVADGMGGHAGGETASRLAADTVATSIIADRSSGLSIEPQTLVLSAVHRANSAVFHNAAENPKLAGMGTTLITMYFHEGKLYIGHVGDSRVYMVRNGQIWQITRDHSLVNEKLRAGLITRDQLAKDKSRNVITRSVGFENSVLVDLYTRDVGPGEFFLACSDGLSGMVNDLDILADVQALGWETPDLGPLAQKLIEHANANGGDDNVSVVVTRIDK